MYRKAYEIRRSHDGYGVYELNIKDGRISSESRMIEHDIFVVMMTKFAAYLQLSCPNLKPITFDNEDVALSEQDENSKEVETKN